MGSVGPSYGDIQIVVDGVSRGTVSCYAAGYAHHVPLFSEGGLEPGPHTIRLVVSGTKNASSSGTVIILDAFEAWSESASASFHGGLLAIEESDARLRYTGAWMKGTSPVFSGGAYWYAYTRGAQMVAVFTGSSITLTGAKGPSYGRMEVFVDGVSKGVIDCYAEKYSYGVTLFSAMGLDKHIHALTVRVLGTKTSASSGVAVVLDGLQVVSGSVKSTPRFETAPSLGYSWSTYIVVDKSDFRLYWVRSGVLRGVYPVAHGKASTPTPSATWRVGAKYITNPAGVYGPRKMRLYRKYGSSYTYTAYGIHGTNEPWVIGTQASHGCIRLYNEDILILWPEVPMYTMVVTRQ